MRNTLACVLAASAVLTLAVAAPAQTPNRAQAIRNQIAELDRAIGRSDSNDAVSEREAAGLRNQLDEVEDLFRRYNSNGLSNSEFNILNDRLRRLRARLGNERQDPGGRRG